MLNREYAVAGLFIGIILAACFACSPGSKVAGGSPGETTNGLTALVKDIHGKPAQARVYLYDLNITTKVDSTQSDSLGRFHFENLSSKSYGVEITNADSSQMLWITNPQMNALDTGYALGKSGKISIITDSTGDTATIIRFLGSPYAAHRVGNSFITSKLPERIYALADCGNHYGGFVSVGDTTHATVHFEKLGVPVENFDDGDERALFTQYWQGSFWYWWLGADSSAGAVLPKSMANFLDGITDSSAWSGKSFHLVYKKPSSTDSASYQWMGFRLGSKLNLTNLDSVSLMVKGNGLVQMGLEHLEDSTDPVGRYSVSSIYQKTVWQDTATSVWRKVVFRMASPPCSASLTSWASISDRVDQFSLFFQGGTDVWIDDIRFYGIDPLQLMVTYVPKN